MGKPEFGRKVKMLKGKNVEINKRGKMSKIKKVEVQNERWRLDCGS
jgi:hypothetical protein